MINRFRLLCERICKGIDKKGIPLEEFCKQTGEEDIERAKYLLYNGYAIFSFKTLSKIAALLDTTVTDLITFEEDTRRKPEFKIENYRGPYVMHCRTLGEARIFCKFTEKNKYTCLPKGEATSDVAWDRYQEKACFDFNNSRFCSKDFYEKYGYTVLDFEDFDWDKIIATLWR